MNILILFTGGTIGSTTRSGVTSPDPAAIETLLKACHFPHKPAENSSSESADPSNAPAPSPPAPADSKSADSSEIDAPFPADPADEIHFETQIPYYILSEELDAKHLNLLTESVSGNLHKGYDGIFITHGSDTLPYAAAMLDTMFADSPIPVIFIGSNFPLDDPRANGTVNLRAALAFLREAPDGGVYAAWRNDPQLADTPVTIHRGCRLLRHMEASGDLHSIGGSPFARYEGGQIIYEKTYVSPSPALSDPAVLDPAVFDLPAGRTELCENPRILQVLCCPGAEYPTPDADSHAVILIPYHSGTLPVNDPAFRAFCTTCRQRNLPVLVPVAGCETYYSSSEAFGDLGITMVPLSSVSLYVRLWITASTQSV